MNTVQVEITRLRHNPAVELPRYESPGASGVDLRADVESPVEILSGRVAAIPCGIAVAVPQGFEAQVRPRSGLALHHQISVLNTPGTIDSDYRGEIMVILANFGSSTFTVNPGTRIAQLVVTPVVRVVWIEKDHLDPTGRSSNGFGSTGID